MSAEFKRQAMANFPPGGSAEGRPSYRMFEEGPLVALQHGFSYWERHTMPDPRLPMIRQADLYYTPFFPPMVVLACLVDDPQGGYVELIDMDIDWDFYSRDNGE